ncbi:MAG: AMP-binding protein [Verrucomicrobiota bacterium]
MTLKALLAQSVARRGDAVALRHKLDDRWLTLSYRDLLARAHRTAEVLARLGVKPGDRVGLLRENAPDWTEIYFGIVGLGATAVPVDPKLQEQEVAHVLRDSGARTLLASARSYPLLREIEPHLPAFEHVVLVEGSELLPIASHGIKYWHYDQQMAEAAEAAGSDRRAYDRHEPKDDDIASFIYTSGTTGRQKAAMLTHRNFVSNVEGCQKAIDIRESDNFLLVLPLHHSFAFTTNLLLPVAAGAEITFVENLKTVAENMREVSPTVLIGVPLLLEKMYNRIRAGVKENVVGRLLFGLGIRAPVRRGIREKLGGRLRLMISGGAPCDPGLLIGLTRFGLDVLEGYGLTETAPVLTFNPPGRPKPGTVGTPIPGVEIRIVDPDAEGIGEIAAKGPSVMTGYYNNPEATAAVFRDGWFLTGDLGVIDAEGYVTITGRKKSTIVNREGKNIHPEEVEHQVCKSPFILEALALGYREAGEKVGEHVGIIVVPNQEALDECAGHHRKTLSEEEAADLVRKEVRHQASKIAEYKRPRRIQIRWEEFEKTSTGKIKRYLYGMTEPEGRL